MKKFLCQRRDGCMLSLLKHSFDEENELVKFME